MNSETGHSQKKEEEMKVDWRLGVVVLLFLVVLLITGSAVVENASAKVATDLALDQVQDTPESSIKLTAWSHVRDWLMYGGWIAVLILGVILYLPEIKKYLDIAE